MACLRLIGTQRLEPRFLGPELAFLCATLNLGPDLDWLLEAGFSRVREVSPTTSPYTQPPFNTFQALSQRQGYFKSCY